jgi:hypothetical protein
MSRSVARSLVRYRSILVALAQAGVTWVILIIAPLGLFNVISCTVLVFASSLMLGTVGDRMVFSLLRRSGWEVMMSDDEELYPGGAGQYEGRSHLSGPDRNVLRR